MKFQLTILIITLITVAVVVVGADENFSTEDEQLNDYAALTLKCLKEAVVSNNGNELLAKVEHFSVWEEEEIPCFTRCLLRDKGYFNIDKNTWNKQQIVDKAGADAYNYCRFELARHYDDACEFAHRGLRCLQQAEQSFRQSKLHLLGCIEELNVRMEQLQPYADFKEPEEIPCLFKCFAEKMHFYTPSYQWNFDNWIKAFGPMKHNASATFACKASQVKIKSQEQCKWMYEEYLCVERLNYNTHGAESSIMPLATTVASILENESVTKTTTTATIKAAAESQQQEESTTPSVMRT